MRLQYESPTSTHIHLPTHTYTHAPQPPTYSELSLEDTDDTLTADPSTPCYQPTIDLKRFQKLLEQEEHPKPVTSDTGPSAETLPLSSTEVRNTGTLESHEQGVQTVGQEGWGQGKNTETVMSELSSISQDAVVDGLVANCTIDSESSSLYVTRPLPSMPKQTHTDEATGEASRTDPRMNTAAGLPPPPTHPLHVTQKMPTPIPGVSGTQSGEGWRSGKAGVRKNSPGKPLNTNGELQTDLFHKHSDILSLCIYVCMYVCM